MPRSMEFMVSVSVSGWSMRDGWGLEMGIGGGKEGDENSYS